MKTTNRTKKIFAIFCAIVLMLCMATPAFADTNATNLVLSLSTT